MSLKFRKSQWLLWMFKRAGEKNSNVTNCQFWQEHDKPIELWSNEVIHQKVDYIHKMQLRQAL
jgi:putative transposase